MSNQFPWFAFYPRDFLNGVLTLSNEQTGIYIKLISAQWIRGPLPDDAGKLARIAGVNQAAFESDIWPDLAEHFTHNADGNLVNPRVEEERQRSLEKSQKRSQAAGKRWQKGDLQVEGAFTQPEVSRACDDLQEAAALDQARADANAYANAHANDDANASAIEDTHARYNHNHSYTSSLRSDDAPSRAAPPSVIDPPDQSRPPQVGLERLPPDQPPPLPPDARTALFRTGLATVARLTGKSPGQCRSLLGKWLKRCRDDASVLNAIIADAAIQGPAEPIAWIEGAIRHREPPSIAAAIQAHGLDQIDLDAPLNAWLEKARLEREARQACLH